MWLDLWITNNVNNGSNVSFLDPIISEGVKSYRKKNRLRIEGLMKIYLYQLSYKNYSNNSNSFYFTCVALRIFI